MNIQNLLEGYYDVWGEGTGFMSDTRIKNRQIGSIHIEDGKYHFFFKKINQFSKHFKNVFLPFISGRSKGKYKIDLRDKSLQKIDFLNLSHNQILASITFDSLEHLSSTENKQNIPKTLLIRYNSDLKQLYFHHTNSQIQNWEVVKKLEV
ncbi:MAG: hypothetical protein GY810_18325 [Aureispira sp.]|nr:hypothetical protein [Aureispira sp.]